MFFKLKEPSLAVVPPAIMRVVSGVITKTVLRKSASPFSLSTTLPRNKVWAEAILAVVQNSNNKRVLCRVFMCVY